MEFKMLLPKPLAAVSGGLGDIGQATIFALASEGIDIAVGDIHPAKKSRSLNRKIRDLGVNFFYSSLDVSNFVETERWYSRVGHFFGRCPNIIVSNAAIATAKRYFELSAIEWHREIEVNLNGAFHFSHVGASLLKSRGSKGRIIFIGSWAAHAAHRELPAYSVSKAGLRMLCKTLALELADCGILVNEIAPGYVDAGLSAKIFAQQPELKQKSIDGIPIKCLIKPADVANQVLYFCGDHTSHMTGSVQLMDGGLSLLQGPLQ